MEHFLKNYLETAWEEIIPYWSDEQATNYYNNCIVILMNYIDQLVQNNLEIESMCDKVFSQYD